MEVGEEGDGDATDKTREKKDVNMFEKLKIFPILSCKWEKRGDGGRTGGFSGGWG